MPNDFRVFDFASPDAHSPQRYLTTGPQQALLMMNSPFVIEQAKGLMQRPEIAAEKISGGESQSCIACFTDARRAPMKSCSG